MYRTWTTWPVGQAATISHIVVETDIYFDKDENTKQYNKYLQAYISANRSRSNAVMLHLYIRKQRLRCLQFVGARVNKLITAGETALISKRMERIVFGV